MIFVDTSAWYALEVPDDKNHSHALAFREELRRGKFGALVTSDYVLDETITLLILQKGAEQAVNFADKISRSRSLHISWIDRDLFETALNLMKRRKDKRWSFTDCTSFSIMEELQLTAAFAFDKNFEQAGFSRLP